MSKFSNDELLDLLKNEFVPVAFDQFYQRQQNDAEGDFYRLIASQGPRKNFSRTTQGCYVTDAAGNFYGYNNNFGPDRLLTTMKQGLKRFNEKKAKLKSVKEIVSGKRDSKYARAIPAGAAVVQVNAKVLYTTVSRLDAKHRQIFENAISRDNLWVLQNEIKTLAQGEMPQSLVQRIVRFHLVDNTRGEPEMWELGEFKMVIVEVLPKGKIEGKVWLETADRSRGYRATVKGFLETDGSSGQLKRFDLLVFGKHWGKSRWVAEASKGEFPLAVAFRVANEKDVAFTVPPQATKGWMEDYLDEKIERE